jgi:hypothetical protein
MRVSLFVFLQPQSSTRDSPLLGLPLHPRLYQLTVYQHNCLNHLVLVNNDIASEAGSSNSASVLLVAIVRSCSGVT